LQTYINISKELGQNGNNFFCWTYDKHASKLKNTFSMWLFFQPSEKFMTTTNSKKNMTIFYEHVSTLKLCDIFFHEKHFFIQHCDIYQHSHDQTNACDRICCLGMRLRLVVFLSRSLAMRMSTSIWSIQLASEVLSSTAHAFLTCKQNHMTAFCFKFSLVNFPIHLASWHTEFGHFIIDYINHHFTIWLLTTTDQMAKWSLVTLNVD
jgi:hypothetical protein